jgi:hypothetical protein
MNRIMTGYEVGYRTVRRPEAFTKSDFFKSRLLFKILFLVGFSSVLALFYIWSRTQVVRLGYEINEYKLEPNRLRDDNKKFKMEIAMLKSPAQLKQLAENNFSMKLATPLEIEPLK